MHEVPLSWKRAWLPILLLSAALISVACPKPAFCGMEEPRSLTAAQQKVQAELDRLDAGLKRAAQKLGTTGLAGDKARPVLAELCRELVFAVDCAAVDPHGNMVAIEPAPFKSFEGKNIGDQEQVKRVMRDRRPVLSGVFRAVEGFPAVDAECPVTTPEGQFLGSVSLLFKPERFLGDTIRPLVQGTPVDIWAMERGGHILYDVDTPQIGLNLFESPLYRPYRELIDLGRLIAAVPEGRGAYRFLRPASKQAVKKNAFWRTVSLYGTEWRLVAIHVEGEGSGKKAEDALRTPTPEEALKSLAAERSLARALAEGNKTEALRLFRDFKDRDLHLQ